MSLPRNTVAFWTEAGPDAPDELKGTNKYFHPERLHWCVSLDRDDWPDVYVVALGPATRVTGTGLQLWSLTGRSSEIVPAWVDVPWDDIDTVVHALRAIADNPATLTQKDQP